MTGRKVEVIYGYHAVRQLLARRAHDVLDVHIASGRQPSARVTELLELCAQHAIATHSIARTKLARMTGSGNHQGIAARCREASHSQSLTLDDLCAGPGAETALILVLDQVLDPHNLGACIRSADAAGVEAVILPKARRAPLNATVSKVASGAMESVHIITVPNIARALRQLSAAGCQIIGADGAAGKTIYDVELRLPAALVMGSEERGMRRNTRAHCDLLARVPMHGSVQSLNLSVAAGICLYEFRKRVFENSIKI